MSDISYIYVYLDSYIKLKEYINKYEYNFYLKQIYNITLTGLLQAHLSEIININLNLVKKNN